MSADSLFGDSLEQQWNNIMGRRGGIAGGAVDDDKQRQRNKAWAIAAIVGAVLAVGALVTWLVLELTKHDQKSDAATEIADIEQTAAAAAAAAAAQKTGSAAASNPSGTKTAGVTTTALVAAAQPMMNDEFGDKSLDEIAFEASMADRGAAPSSRTIQFNGRAVPDKAPEDEQRTHPVQAVRDEFVDNTVVMTAPPYVSEVFQRHSGIPTEDDIEDYKRALKSLSASRTGSDTHSAELEHFNMA